MKTTNKWYEGIEKEIGSLKEKVSKSDSKLYELGLLLRVAKRVAGFSYRCEHCQGHRSGISNLVTNLESLPMTNEGVADYGSRFRSIIEHLNKSHGLHRSLPNPVYPLVIAIVAPLIYFGIAYLQDSQVDLSDAIGRVFIGSLLFIIPIIVALVFGILRLFMERI